jgi:hypothetical protein
MNLITIALTINYLVSILFLVHCLNFQPKVKAHFIKLYRKDISGKLLTISTIALALPLAPLVLTVGLIADMHLIRKG